MIFSYQGTSEIDYYWICVRYVSSARTYSIGEADERGVGKREDPVNVFVFVCLLLSLS